MLLESEWCMPWSAEVYAYDACETGIGACCVDAAAGDVAALGRQRERLRFLSEAAIDAREHAAACAPACTFGARGAVPGERERRLHACMQVQRVAQASSSRGHARTGIGGNAESSDR